jgi:Trk K+ transport system NAD-binding subunit
VPRTIARVNNPTNAGRFRRLGSDTVAIAVTRRDQEAGLCELPVSA